MKGNGLIPLPFGGPQRWQIGLESAREHFSGREGELLVTEKDWVAAVALSTTESSRKEKENDPTDVAAKLSLWKAGIELKFSEEKRRGVLEHAAAVLAGQGKPIDSVRERIEFLMKEHEKKEVLRKKKAYELYLEMSDLLPEGMELLDHQKEALVEIEKRGFRCVVHDDLGLGKTIEILCALLLRAKQMGKEEVFPVFIGCPASMVGAWKQHAKKWLSLLQVSVDDLESAGKDSVVVNSYGSLLSVWREVKALNPRSVVFDESHYLVDPESQRSKAAILTSGSVRNLLLATATMTPNGRPEEAFLQLKLCDRALQWREYRYEWCNAHRRPTGRKTKGGEPIQVWNTSGASNPVGFGKLVHKLSFRRWKTDLKDSLALPEQARFILPVEASKELFDQIEEERTKVKARLEEKASESREKGKSEEASRIEDSELFSMLTKCRILVGKHKIPAAIERTSELLSDGHRIVLFCFHPQVAEAIHSKLMKTQAGKQGQVFLGTADLTADQRFELVQDAQENGKIIVLTYAYCEGVTLTSFDRVLMVERHWIPDKELQAEARIHRIGQKAGSVASEYLVCPSTIDDMMTQIHTIKETRSRSVVASTAIRQWICR